MLTSLRQGDEPPLRDPTPSLGRLDDLLARTATGGLQIRTEIVGDLGSLPASVDLAAYRILQEALTNIIRHAGVASAVVRVVHRSGSSGSKSTTRVARRRRRRRPSPARQGDQGMRERASALGGILGSLRGRVAASGAGPVPLTGGP